MLFRFSLYGFLKNQRYFEPFLLLAFLDKGLTFFAIGLLLGFREVCINLLEIPTGAVADVAGRRRAMICSHVAYVISFLTFGFTHSVPALFLAMFVFSVGEAFRTGTHKAIIFDWLKHQGRQEEKTKVYGFTRSWSQVGSAVSVLIAAGFVVVLEEYSVIFWLSAIPAGLNVVNFLTYPKYLDGQLNRPRSRQAVVAAVWTGTRQCLVNRPLRRLLCESMGFEGLYKSSKDYLQPIVQQTVMALPVLVALSTTRRTAILMGLVYAVLHLLCSVASRRADALGSRWGDERRAMSVLWLACGGAFSVLLVSSVTSWSVLGILSFLVLALLQNLWRPIVVGRIADLASGQTMATVLSVESQSKTFFVAVAAPVIGLLVDVTPPAYRFAPIALFGLVIAGLGILAHRQSGSGPIPD